MNDIPCKCGHDKADHPKVGKYAGSLDNDYLVCNGCFLANRTIGFNKIACWEYTPDNLLFIEKLAKERGLV